MSKVKLAVSSIAILAGAACAAPWYNGVHAEQKMRAELEMLAADKQSPLTISVTRFDHGWLASQAVSRVALKADPNIHVDVRHEIAHVPDRTSWVHVHSVPQWTGELKAVFDYYFDNQAPLVVDTVYNYDGTRISQFSSPAFAKPLPQRPETTVTWGGMQGTLSLDSDAHYVGTATVPSLAIDAGDGQATLTGLKMDGTWDAHGTAIDWQGDLKLAIAEFRYVTALTQIAAKDIGGSAYQHSKGNYLQLGYALRVGFGSSAHAGDASQTISNAVLELEFDKLSKVAMSKYLSDFSNVEKLGIAPEARTRLATQLVMKLGTDLLRGSPELHLKKIGVETPSGSLLAHATVTFDGNNMPDMLPSPELLTRLKAKADVKISGTLLRTQLQNRVRPQVEVALREQGGVGTEENIRAMSEKAIDDQLKGLTDSGVLRAAGPDYTVDAEFAMGQMLVNGLPANQMLGGLLGAPSPVAPQKPAPASEAAAPAPASNATLAERRSFTPAPPTRLR